MDALLGLFSLAAVALFLSRVTRRAAGLCLLPALALCMLWLGLAGVAGLLIPGGFAWYTAAIAALVYTLLREKKGILARVTDTGFLFFLVGGVFFVCLFFATKPLFTEWDEFTVWGTAAKVTFENGRLYTTASSNLLARSQPPSLIVLGWMVQFFAPAFAEYKVMAAYALVSLAAAAAGASAFRKHRAAALCLAAAMALLPFFFEAGTASGNPSTAYLSVLADVPMAAFFGGTLCFWFAGGEPDQRLVLPFLALLAALTNMKDMGFALALLCWFIAGADLLLVRRKEARLWRLKGTRAAWLSVAAGLVVTAATWAGWALHLRTATGSNRMDLGSSTGGSFTVTDLASTALGAFFGLKPHEQYGKVLPMMLEALAGRPVSLLGPGLVLLALLALLLAAAFFLAAERRQRRRVAVFAVTSMLGFAAYYIFHLFLYAFIFKEVEALILKDYLRYISTYWQGWLMAALCLLAGSAAAGRELRLRVQLARWLNLAVCFGLAGAVLLLGNGQQNVLVQSPSVYSQRHDVRRVIRAAEAEGLENSHVVYLLSQGDAGSRGYQFRYELRAELVPQYAGVEENDAGERVYLSNIGTSLVPEKGFVPSYYTYTAVATPKLLAGYLREAGVTHFLIDQPDAHFLKRYAKLFDDELAGWSDTEPFAVGRRYYRVAYLDNGSCRFERVVDT